MGKIAVFQEASFLKTNNAYYRQTISSQAVLKHTILRLIWNQFVLCYISSLACLETTDFGRSHLVVYIYKKSVKLCDRKINEKLIGQQKGLASHKTNWMSSVFVYCQQYYDEVYFHQYWFLYFTCLLQICFRGERV